MIVVTAGHVDHGKTSLVKQLTGTDTDRLAEEKARGLTINLGFAYYQTNNGATIGFVDVPGHINFINNMLAGVAAVDFALLVVAADDGPMPQTREHLDIIQLLGIQQGAIALTKVDLVDEARLGEVNRELQVLLQNTVLAQAPIFSVANTSGQGIKELRDYLGDFAKQSSISPDSTLPAKMPRYCVDRSFTLKGFGTVVTGTLVAGEISVGDNLYHSGTGMAVRVKSMRLDQSDINHAHAGQRLAMNIDIAHQMVHRGDWLLEQELVSSSRDIDVCLRLLNKNINQSLQLTNVHFYHFASHRMADVQILNFPQRDEDDTIFAKVKLNSPLFGCAGDRFILRDAAGETTIGGGYIVDIQPPTRKRHSEERQQFLKAMNLPMSEAIQVLLDWQQTPVKTQFLRRAFNTKTDSLNLLLAEKFIDDNKLVELLTEKKEMGSNKPVVLLGGESAASALLGTRQFLEYSQGIFSTVQQLQQRFPERQGTDALALKRECQFSYDYAFFQQLVDKLITLGHLQKTGTLLHTPGHSAQERPEDLAFFRRLQPLLLKDEKTPPRTRELCEQLDIPLNKLDLYCHRLCQSGKLAQVAANRYYLPESLVKLAGAVEDLAKRNTDGLFSVIEFRDHTQMGRNLCIQVLEFFDRQGFTVRRSNKRLVRKNKEAIFSPA